MDTQLCDASLEVSGGKEGGGREGGGMEGREGVRGGKKEERRERKGSAKGRRK